MNALIAIKLLSAVGLLLLFFFAAYKSRKAGGFLVVTGIILGEMIVTVALIWAVTWSIDVSFKKAKLISFKTTRISSQEKLMIKGVIKNVGKYPINNLFVKVKIINAVSYGGKMDSSRSNTVDETIKVRMRRPLLPGATKRFSTAIHYPPYFNLAGTPQRSISWN